MTDVIPLPRLLLFPFNGNAKEALACLPSANQVLGFVDDAFGQVGRRYGDLPVLTRVAFDEWPDALVLAVPGSPRSYRDRRAIIEGLGLAANRFAQVIHPRSAVSPLATLGVNVLIMAGVVITSDAVIEDHVCILPNSVVHHDVRIGQWSLVGSNVTIAGGVSVGRGCYLGSGTSVRDGVAIGDGALVGIGSTVIRDVAPHAVVAGSPARVLRDQPIDGAAR